MLDRLGRPFHAGSPPDALAVVTLFVVLLSGSWAAADEEDDVHVPEQRLYRISPEDVLHISVWKEPDLDKEVVVRPDGLVSFPLAGHIEAAGQTPQQLQQQITERISRYVPDAVVTVSVKELSGLRLYVTGRVEKPGQYQVGRYIDVLQALTLAGGPTPFANTSDIRIIRREGGREVVYEFNYDQVKKGRELEQNILLQADDVVVVP